MINDSAALSFICLLSTHNKHVISELDTAERLFQRSTGFWCEGRNFLSKRTVMLLFSDTKYTLIGLLTDKQTKRFVKLYPTAGCRDVDYVF